MATITKYPGGRWRAQVRKAGFATRSEIFPTRKRAETWASGIEKEMDEHTYRDPSRFAKDTIGALFERFRDEICKPSLEAIKAGKNRHDAGLAFFRKGARWDIVRINALIRDAEFVKRRTLELMPADLRKWRDKRLEQIAPPSVNREMNLISSIFSHAMAEWDYPWRVNPIHEVGRPEGASGIPRKRRWTDAELQAILTASNYDPETPPRAGADYVPWGLLLIIESAMRPKEFCTAKVKDAQLERRCLVLHDSKNGNARDVPLSSKAVQIIATLTRGKSPDEKIFPMTSDTLGNYYREVRVKAGLKEADLRFYDGKHEAISRMARKFRDAVELSKVTGHKDLKCLSVYFNPTVEELADKLG